ncbi:hypothetical protein BX600DRAFT_518762 [Xylariales sp. PMI_506]|nr:hypothetical protein BX600DRAFT_518762 [Xylariales sp. PMI_506]
MDHQQASPLFLISFEIRCRIYEYYLTFTFDEFAYTLRPTHKYLDAAEPHSTPLPGLMLACKRLYAELRGDVHGAAALRVHQPGLHNERRVGFAVHGTLRLERLRRMSLVIDMEYAYWNAWLELFVALMGRTSELEYLTIDWAPRPVALVHGWERKQAEKKAHVFLQVLNNIPRLQTVRIYGMIPEY